MDANKRAHIHTQKGIEFRTRRLAGRLRRLTRRNNAGDTAHRRPANILTQLGELERVGRIDDVDEGLQLEATRRHVYVVIEHGEFECRLHLVGALLEYGTCGWGFRGRGARDTEQTFRQRVCD